MAKIARSVTDTILGEAVGGTREQRFRDMLGIASVISNRATVLNTTPQNVVSNKREFNAYGKALPPGASNYADLAKEAWDSVQTDGPIHHATFFATPKTSKNLPGGLTPVDATTGHMYFSDPQNRAIRTKTGFLAPVLNAAEVLAERVRSALPDIAPLASPRPENVELSPQNAETAVPEVPEGFTLDAPAVAEGQPGSLNFYHPDQTGITKGLKDALTGLSAAMGKTVGITSGYRSPAYNAAQGGAKQSRHMHGDAVDIDMHGWTDAEKKQAVQELTQRGVTAFISYTKTPDMMHVDMRPRPEGVAPMFMVDRLSQERFPEHFDKNAPGWMKDMAALGGIDFAPENALTPTDKPSQDEPATAEQQTAGYKQAAESLADAGLRSLGPVGTTPAEGYGQAAESMGKAGVRGIGTPDTISSMLSGMDHPATSPSIADAAAKANAEPGGIAAMNAGLEKLGAAAAPVTAAPAPAANSEARAKAAEAANQSAEVALGSMLSGMDKIDKAAAETKAAETKAAANAYGALGQGLTQAGVKLDGAAVPGAVPGNKVAAAYKEDQQTRMLAPAEPAPTVEVKPADPTINEPARALPAPKEVPDRKVAVPQTVVTKSVSKPASQQDPSDALGESTISRPSATAGDVYSGRANVGVANDGSVVSRDALGQTSVTNKYGVTTKTNVNGRQMASGNGLGDFFSGFHGFLGNDEAEAEAPSDANAALSDAGGLSKPGPADKKSGVGKAARGIAGAVVGAALGTAVAGPIGGAIGGKIGGAIGRSGGVGESLGKGPLGGIFGGFGGNNKRSSSSSSGSRSSSSGSSSKSGGRSSSSSSNKGSSRSDSSGY